jgi:hypothetical protein
VLKIPRWIHSEEIVIEKARVDVQVEFSRA